MNKTRLEAFSDGVIAIIITIMVLEMKAPHGAQWGDLFKLWPVFLSYILSFVYVGIYWANHHHLLHLLKHVDGRVLLANLHLLFWLSLVPFVTGWMGENHFAAIPVFVYAIVMLMAGVSYQLLIFAIRAVNQQDHLLGGRAGQLNKGHLSLTLYALAALVSFWQPWLSLALFATVALMWFIPDRRIERLLQSEHQQHK